MIDPHFNVRQKQHRLSGPKLRFKSSSSKRRELLWAHRGAIFVFFYFFCLSIITGCQEMFERLFMLRTDLCCKKREPFI